MLKRFPTLVVALTLFGLTGSAAMVTVPWLFAGSERPGFAIFLVAGVAAIVLTAVLFAYVYSLGMGFGRTVLVLAAGCFCGRSTPLPWRRGRTRGGRSGMRKIGRMSCTRDEGGSNDI